VLVEDKPSEFWGFRNFVSHLRTFYTQSIPGEQLFLNLLWLKHTPKLTDDFEGAFRVIYWWDSRIARFMMNVAQEMLGDLTDVFAFAWSGSKISLFVRHPRT
jgi:hypothetical protein